MQKINPCLWFDNQAEEAVQFYASIFKNTKILKLTRYGKSQPGREGQVLTILFTMLGQHFMALNGGPHFKFTEAMSLVVNCETQKEVDYYWNKLTEGGTESQCGWLKDKFGLSWQVVHTALPKYLADKNPDKAAAVMQAMMQMRKLDVLELKKAYESAGRKKPLKRK